jgi:hypothetical protein
VTQTVLPLAESPATTCAVQDGDLGDSLTPLVPLVPPPAAGVDGDAGAVQPVMATTSPTANDMAT